MERFFLRNRKIGIIGAGSWGTTLAVLLSRRHEVRVWDYDTDHVNRIRKDNENKKFLPGIRIPGNISFFTEIGKMLENSSIVLLAIPSHTIRSVVRSVRDLLQDKILINVAKGIENRSLKRISEILYEETGSREIYTLSGPSHAEEVSRKIPTTVVVAGFRNNIGSLKSLQRIFITEYFRVYTNEDIIGVELAGSLKNIIAIACGISDGLGFGSNTKAALMTRGLAEIRRLGIKMGAKDGTFAGLAGMGDLITTCISPYSRNRHVGEELGRGKHISEVLKDMVMVAEGVRTTRSAHELARKYRVAMPITEQVFHILFRNRDPLKAVRALMTREPKAEHH